jgi:VanZ family protein
MLPQGVEMNIRVIAKASWMFMFWSCGAIILILALMPPTPDLPSTGWDKSNHVLAFIVLTVLGCHAYPNRIAVVLVGAFLYGGLIEVLQSFTPYRSAEWADLIADAIGVFVGRALLVLLCPRPH